MRQPPSLTVKLFATLVLTAIVIGATGLKTYEYFSYEVEREKLSVRVATASVRISKALIKPARNADIAGVRQILSAFAASPEISMRLSASFTAMAGVLAVGSANIINLSPVECLCLNPC